MMITGDYHHTAIAVARDVGMLNPEAEVVIIDAAKHSHSQLGCPGQNPPGHHRQAAADSALGQEAEKLGQNRLEDAGLLGNVPGRNADTSEYQAEHSLEAQLSIGHNALGRFGSWATEQDKEEAQAGQNAGSVQSPQGLSLASPGQPQPLAARAGGDQHVAFAQREGNGQIPAGLAGSAPCQYHPSAEQGRRTGEQELSRSFSDQLRSDGAGPCVHLESAAAASEAALDCHHPAGAAPVPSAKQKKPAVSHRSSVKKIGLGPSAQSPSSCAPLPSARSSRKTVTICQLPTTAALPLSGLCMSPGQAGTSPQQPVIVPSADEYHHSQGGVSPSCKQEDQAQVVHEACNQQHQQPSGVCPPASYTQSSSFSRVVSSARRSIQLFRLSGREHRPQIGGPSDPPATPRASLAGLRFIKAQSNQDCEASWALTALTEGRLQCAVTGDAFDHVLRLGDTALLESIMRNSVVFARMKPHQKGQVVDLLGAPGIHQLFNGQPRHIQVACGCCQ